jgi:hypothetical protein
MKIDGVSAVLVILIGSFAIDRGVTALLFVLQSFGAGRRLVPESDERKMKWARFALAAALAGVVLAWFGKVHLLAAVGFPGVNEYVDVLITTVILVGGSDRVTDILKATGMPHSDKDVARQPIEITGKLVLEDSSAKFVAR